MNEKDKKVALITGTSAGIGHATALALAEAGFTTYATARNPDSIVDLKKSGLRTLQLDVTDESSMAAAVREIESRHPAVDVLVNNAGYSEMGAIEEVGINRVRLQFETNVFGALRLCQLVLPGMRRKRSGRIVNISSMGGEFTTPYAGIYHASKSALESVSDALRFEVQDFGIHVIVIQPGVVRTRSAASVAQTIHTHEGSPYLRELNAFRRFLEKNSADTDPSAVSPEEVAKVIVNAINAPEPGTRYKVGDEAEQLTRMRRKMSDREWDALFRKQFSV